MNFLVILWDDTGDHQIWWSSILNNPLLSYGYELSGVNLAHTQAAREAWKNKPATVPIENIRMPSG